VKEAAQALADYSGVSIESEERDWRKYNPPQEIADILDASPSVTVASTVEELVGLAYGVSKSHTVEVAFDTPGKGRVLEAVVSRVRNGVVANYPDPYMRRRDPDCMVISDEGPTNKPRFTDRFGYNFESLRSETFEWLKTQPLALFGFIAGQHGMGRDALVVAPDNCGFFALGLALLQGILPYDEISEDFHPEAIIYVAPPFRHTHFDGKQVVVHHRSAEMHEIFSYNLYPGPSAKKGIYGVLIGQGEREGWVTAHCSTVQVVTPYDNVVTFMHEGASGGGKSEMLEHAHRDEQGRLRLGANLVTGERRYLEIPRLCRLLPVTDDMALCHPSLQDHEKKMRVTDAEDAWFLRVNHITHYGTDAAMERMTAQPNAPLLFLNIDASPDSRALIWEHIQDAPGVPCPNPRVVVPRTVVPDVVHDAVTVDIRSFGVRTPPCTREKPSYGIIGLFHVLPPAIAWLWRLVAPRGHANPSIVDTAGMTSEGVGSYWPFATGRRVDQANLLLKQFQEHTRTRYILCPNQHIGAWEVGFMPQWITREYLARRGNAQFKEDQVQAARCPLLGYALYQLAIEGRPIARWFLQVDTQPEVGEEAYDYGAKMLYDFFRKCLADFNEPDLDPMGRRIVECCLDGGTVSDYETLIPSQ
jgi:hypothetical protein